jgi:hypothetical protein
MKPVTAEEKKQILEEVKSEFPNDRVMQEIHYSRQLRIFELRDLPLEERLRQLLRHSATAPHSC